MNLIRKAEYLQGKSINSKKNYLPRQDLNLDLKYIRQTCYALSYGTSLVVGDLCPTRKLQNYLPRQHFLHG